MRRRQRPAACSACGTAPLARMVQPARISRSPSAVCTIAPTTCPGESLPAASRLQQRRPITHRRKHPRTGDRRRTADDQVELPARQHRQRAGNLDPATARPDRRHVAGAMGGAQNLIEHAEPAQRAMRVGDQTVAADLVAREGLAVDQHHVDAGARQPLRSGAAGRAGANDQHLAMRWQLIGGPVELRSNHRATDSNSWSADEQAAKLDELPAYDDGARRRRNVERPARQAAALTFRRQACSRGSV